MLQNNKWKTGTTTGSTKGERGEGEGGGVDIEHIETRIIYDISATLYFQIYIYVFLWIVWSCNTMEEKVIVQYISVDMVMNNATYVNIQYKLWINSGRILQESDICWANGKIAAYLWWHHAHLKIIAWGSMVSPVLCGPTQAARRGHPTNNYFPLGYFQITT